MQSPKFVTSEMKWDWKQARGKGYQMTDDAAAVNWSLAKIMEETMTRKWEAKLRFLRWNEMASVVKAKVSRWRIMMQWDKSRELWCQQQSGRDDLESGETKHWILRWNCKCRLRLQGGKGYQMINNHAVNWIMTIMTIITEVTITRKWET